MRRPKFARPFPFETMAAKEIHRDKLTRMSIILPENDTLRTVQLDRGIDVLDRGIYFFDVPTPLPRFFMNE